MVTFAAIDWSPAPEDERVLIRKEPLYAAPEATAEAVREAVTQFAGYLTAALPELHKLEVPTLLPHIEDFLTKIGRT